MIAAPYRVKGGAPLLGARVPGEAGPFGRHPDVEDVDDQEQGDDGTAGD
ncbi:hypothetical protein [Streptomyces sp. NBC_01439]|nr:hypothetical protein [Streptomyces sp. NBC_01439]